MKVNCYLLILLLSLVSLISLGQEVSFGDKKAQDEIKKKTPKLSIRFSLAEQKISKDKSGSIKMRISVRNISTKSVLIVINEAARLSYHTKKRELGLNLWRDYSEFDYDITQLKLLKSNKRLIVERSVPKSLFIKMSDGIWQMDSSIGFIAEKDFGKLGLAARLLKNKNAKDTIKIPYSSISPHQFAEIQKWETSNKVEIDLNPPNNISFGNPSVQDKIKKKTSEIYDSKTKPYFFFTTKSFGKKSTCGMEIIAHEKSLRFNRIATKSCSDKGRLATEYYFERKKAGFTDKEKLIFVYQVFEYYNEKAKSDAWRNFKGLASWESRYYFVDSELEFHRHKGQKDIAETETGEKQKTEAFKILGFVKSQTSK